MPRSRGGHRACNPASAARPALVIEPQKPRCCRGFFCVTRPSFAARLARVVDAAAQRRRRRPLFAGRHMPIDEPLGIERRRDGRGDDPGRRGADFVPACPRIVPTMVAPPDSGDTAAWAFGRGAWTLLSMPSGRSPMLPRAPRRRPSSNAGMSSWPGARTCCGRRRSGPP
jgi:hypothetical protein